jgi:hypothetical protein
MTEFCTWARHLPKGIYKAQQPKGAWNSFQSCALKVSSYGIKEGRKMPLCSVLTCLEEFLSVIIKASSHNIPTKPLMFPKFANASSDHKKVPNMLLLIFQKFSFSFDIFSYVLDSINLCLKDDGE